MTATMVQTRVKDYTTWRKAFDSMQELRNSGGATTDRIYRDADDPNKVTVILRWKSLVNARNYLTSAEFKDALARAGVLGQSTIYYFDEV
ncbi:MAG: antibiotic biosynthesis monooxygenase [Acidobacteriaceae bacterium]